MKLVKVMQENLSEFLSFLKKEEEALDEYEYEGYYFISYLLDEIEKKDYDYLFNNCLLFIDEEIVSFGTISDAFGGKVKTISLYSEDKDNLLLLKEYYPDYILDSNSFSNCMEYGFFPCKYSSSFNEEWEYHVSGNYYVTKEENTFILRDLFEEKYFPTLGEIEYQLLSTEELSKVLLDKEDMIFSVPIWRRGNSAFAGFHYLEPQNFMYSKMNYLVAKTNGKIIGVIKFGEWSMVPGAILVSYIDVCEKYWGNGIATGMIKELNSYIDKEKIYVTAESERGKKCHMLDTFKKYLSCKIEVI